MEPVVYIGVDVSRQTLDVSMCMGSASELTTELGQFANTPAGFKQLKRRLHKACGPETICHLILEPTGSYHLALVAFANEQDWRVSLPNPQLVREWAKGQGQRAKTDRIDGDLLSRFGAKEKPAPQEPLPPEVEELDELLHRQDDLEKMLQQERNRLHSLERRPRPSRAVIRSVKKSIQSLERALEEVKRAIKEHLRQHPQLKHDYHLLLQVPGIGEKTVLPILVFLHRWQCRTGGQGDAKGLVAFAGLDPVAHSSGTSVRKRPAISKMGDADIRRRLFLAALGGTKANDTPLTQFYRRLVGRHKPAMVALIASARKILVWAFAVFTYQQPFDSQLASASSA